MDAVTKTIGIRLNISEEQEQELKNLFHAFGAGINWSLKEIEKRYQAFLQAYKEIPKENRETGQCSSCGNEKLLAFKSRDSKLHCVSCATKTFSEYTVRKEIYGTGARTVEDDLKAVVDIPNKTHYTFLYSQAYAIWKSYNAWRNKRHREKELLDADIARSDQRYLKAAELIEQKAADIKREKPKMIWKTAKALATKEIYRDWVSEKDQNEIERLHDKLMERRRLMRPIHFPQMEQCNTVMLASSFVKWDKGRLYTTLWSKGQQEIKYFGNEPRYLFCWDDDNERLIKFLGRKFGIKNATIEKADDKTVRVFFEKNSLSLRLNDEKTRVTLEMDDGRTSELTAKTENGKLNIYGRGYLDQFIPLMEESSVYCNLTRKGGQYYLMYPLPIKLRHPPDIKECDTFVFMSSPTKTGIFGYDRDGALNSVKWFDAGKLIFAKRIFKEKRASIAMRRSPEEKMRKIRRRKKKIRRRGDMERRFVSTFNHQLTRKMIDHVMDLSENPKILLWDVGNGITQNFGRKLNYLKNLWSVVQQQEYLKHKAMQLSIPVVEILYNKCNDISCSACGAKQMTGKKPSKVITQLIKNVKNFKCGKCGYETSMLINQANNIANLSSS